MSSEIPADRKSSLEVAYAALQGVPIQFWACPHTGHDLTGTVTWHGDVAECDVCGFTSDMTRERDEAAFAAGVQAGREAAAADIEAAEVKSLDGSVDIVIRGFREHFARIARGGTQEEQP